MTKILVADDEPNILSLVTILFKSLGHDVVQAVNGEDAIEKAIAEKPDLIITDVIMPKKGGFDVCRSVRNIPSIAHTPILILSAMGDEFNKITGFEEGADDYVTKPFSVEELKARVRSLLIRTEGRKTLTQSITPTAATSKVAANSNPDSPQTNKAGVPLVSTGIPALDLRLFGGLPKGSNILVVGPVGSGKSHFARQFLTQGLKAQEPGLFVAVDDNPLLIRSQLEQSLQLPLTAFERQQQVRIVDAFSWFAPVRPEERISVRGPLNLSLLLGAISDAGAELGQTVQRKVGGRRVIDSISSLLLHFPISDVQRFINQVTRTSLAFGGVITLFLCEEASNSQEVLSHIRYLMDGVIEFKTEGMERWVRAASMKWSEFQMDWERFT